VLKFADDTKVFTKIKSRADRQQLQDDLNTLTEWSERWQMLFTFGKCNFYMQRVFDVVSTSIYDAETTSVLDVGNTLTNDVDTTFICIVFSMLF